MLRRALTIVVAGLLLVGCEYSSPALPPGPAAQLPPVDLDLNLQPSLTVPEIPSPVFAEPAVPAAAPAGLAPALPAGPSFSF
jgi:hypothetical protein